MSEEKRVLAIGGSGDGKWFTTTEDHFRVAKPVDINYESSLSFSVSLDDTFDEYRVERFAIFGFQVRVGIHTEFLGVSQDRHRAIVRALFQRDVAEAMGA